VTAVDITTGEIVEFDRAAAERRAERIRLRLDTIADNYVTVMPMIREAIEKRDDLALGYRSPGDYVQDRFGGALQRLDLAVRRAVVHELTEAGLSTRAIAPVVGVSKDTVHRDAGVSYETPGTRVPAQTPTPAAGVDVEPSQKSYVCEEAHNRTTAVTGIDGKTYPKPEPKKPRRTPLPDTAWRVAYDLRKKSESLTRVIEDDRFKSNKEQIAGTIRNELLLVQKAVAAALQELPEEN